MSRLVLLANFMTGISSLAIRPRADKFEWTALGDSYASGVGSTDYVDGRRCLRYNDTYSIQLNNGDDLAPGEHIFNNVPCSGALYNEIAEWQLLDESQSTGPNWQYGPRPAFGNPSFATLTAGGDDIDFPGIIFNCILDWHLWGGPVVRTCDDQRAFSRGRLEDPQLITNLSSLIGQVVDKGRSRPIGNDFKLYVTGYPKFFSTETDECDSVTFARTANPVDDGNEHPRMTQAIRRDFNELSDLLNKAVQAAVEEHKDDGVKFIDIEKNEDGSDALQGHRYCEPGIKEPDTGNPELYMWHYPYNDPKAVDDRSDPTVALLQDAYSMVVGDFSTEQIAARWPTTIQLHNAVFDVLSEDDIQDKATATIPGWDSIGFRARVFHPQVQYHRFIRDRILAQYKKDTPAPEQPEPEPEPQPEPEPEPEPEQPKPTVECKALDVGLGAAKWEVKGSGWGDEGALKDKFFEDDLGEDFTFEGTDSWTATFISTKGISDIEKDLKEMSGVEGDVRCG